MVNYESITSLLFVVRSSYFRIKVTEVGTMMSKENEVYYRPLDDYRDAYSIKNVSCLQIRGPVLFINMEKVKEKILYILKAE